MTVVDATSEQDAQAGAEPVDGEQPDLAEGEPGTAQPEAARPPSEDGDPEDISDREAAELDRQLGDGDVTEDDPDAQEPEPEAAAAPVQDTAPSSLKQLQQLDKALKSEGTRHENALAKAYGDSWEDYLMCPACLGEGFMLPVPPGQMPDEIWQALQSITGHMPTEEMRHPDTLVRCQRCDGFGQVLTGARGEHTSQIVCAPCEGRGYFDTDNPLHRTTLGLAPEPIQAQLPPPYPVFHGLEPAVAQDVNMPPVGWEASGKPGADSWGRWPGHPRYGIDPALNGGTW